MKKTLCRSFVVAIALVGLLSGQVQAVAWTTNGILVNPAINAILADSGPLTGGPHYINAFVASTVQAVVIVEWMDAANVSVVKAQALFVAASSNTPFIPNVQINEIQTNERIRLRLNAAITGSIQGSVFVQ